MNWEEIQLFSESWDFEAKAAQGRDGKGEIPKSMWETYSAFANTKGGLLVLGLKEHDDHSLEPVGIEDINRLETDFWNQINSPEKVSVNLLSEDDVQRVSVNGKTLLAISVPRADRKERPVYIGKNPLTGTFRRNFEGDYHCKKDDVRRMMADADDRSRDSEILEHFDMNDVDIESLDAFRNLFKATQPGHPFLVGDNQELLRNLGGWLKDRKSGIEGLTLAGLLMFGKQRSILDRLGYYNLDYRELPDEHDMAATRWLDRVCVDGTWPGNVFSFYQKVFRKLTADLKVPFRLDTRDLFRRDETPVHEAIREALANALIHADYTGTRGIRIFKKPNGFEFINPGLLRVPLESLWEGGVSDCRNHSIQRMFQMIGVGEKAGSGFPKIREAWAGQHWRRPEIVEVIDSGFDETSLALNISSLIPDETIKTLSDRFPDFAQLTENQRLILVAALDKELVNHRSLARSVGGHSRDLTLDLQTLIRKGMLERIGSGRGCSYQLRHDNRCETYHDISKTYHDTSNPESNDAAGKPPASGARNVREQILMLCTGRYLTRDDLAAELNRNAVYVRNTFLKPMVAEGVLELRFPDRPRHKEQAYRTVVANAKSPKEES